MRSTKRWIIGGWLGCLFLAMPLAALAATLEERVDLLEQAFKRVCQCAVA